ncbi:MAG: hypothetical protein B0D86_00545, partial [Candidatus Sedimenticola endophacoides]
NRRADAGYSQEDIELLERFAFQVQLNIENIFLRQEIVKVSELLGEKIRKLERALIRYGEKHGSHPNSPEEEELIHLVQDELSSTLHF